MYRVKKVTRYVQPVLKSSPLATSPGERVIEGNLGVISYATKEDWRGGYKKGGATDKQRKAEHFVIRNYPKAIILIVQPDLVFDLGE